MLIEELQHLIKLNPDTGVERLVDGPAMDDRIREWFETPEGTVADLPSWGHNLTQFKHSPMTTSLEVVVKISIRKKMPIDIRNLIITQIAVEFREIDLFHVAISHKIGTYAGEVLI